MQAMSGLTGKARTAETYLAGLGASGALIASAVVAFLLLAGAVVFDVWPRASGLFGSGDAGAEQVDADVPAGTAAAALGSATDQVAGSAGRPLVDRSGGADGGTGSGPSEGGGGTGGGSGTGTDTGSGGGAGSADSGGGGSTVGDTVNQVGNTVNNTVNGAGNTVNNTVNGAGNTVNNTVDGVGNTVNGLLGDGN
jgi:hypothetical protein